MAGRQVPTFATSFDVAGQDDRRPQQIEKPERSPGFSEWDYWADV